MQNKFFSTGLIIMTSTLLSCQTTSFRSPVPTDENLWLEEIESPKALEFAKAENEKTLSHFRKNPLFSVIEKETRAIVLANDRMPTVSLEKGELYNFWQDQKNVRGLWRRTSPTSYKTKNPKWETLLDLDTLAKNENENWVWKGSQFLPPKNERALIFLSRGGKDAIVVREYDVIKKQFIADGFTINEAKTHASWLDQDRIFVGTDFGPNSLTTSGYPRIIKLWTRGTPLEKAETVFEAGLKDQSAYSYTIENPEGKYILHTRRVAFYESMTWYQKSATERLQLPVPTTAEFEGIFKEQMLFSLRDNWGSFTKGSLISIPLSEAGVEKEKALPQASLVFAPTEKMSLRHVSVSKNALFANILDNVLAKVLRIELGPNHSWITTTVELGKNGMLSVYSTDSESEDYLLSYSDFLTPPSVYLGQAPLQRIPQPKLLKSAPPRFKSKGLHTQRFEARSADGTMIPYFVVSKTKLKPDGENPTLLYGYGGFEISLTPSYSGTIGKVWLEKGGVYVMANLRGGGEFGPAWHQSVLKENRMKVYEDFIAIAEDLIAKKITKPEHLGISGRSNGGLLTGATFIKRPDLFGAVISGVPLLDMLRYHKLLAGASWVGEYGDPEDPKMRDVLMTYSPYQNVKKEIAYPEVLFMTSTKDDRVHPGHARKMVARMKAQGHPVYYYENTEGGHGGSANLEQIILWNTLEYTYLWEKLGAQP